MLSHYFIALPLPSGLKSNAMIEGQDQKGEFGVEVVEEKKIDLNEKAPQLIDLFIEKDFLSIGLLLKST